MKSGIERIGRTVTLQAAQRSCLDKKRYASRNHARDAAAKNQKLFGPTAARFWYACTLCAGWHLTSKGPNEKQPRQRVVAPQYGKNNERKD
jgi:hypothetical protein